MASIAHAQTSYPMLMSVHPVAAQVGQASEHEVNARYNLFGAYQVLVTGTGVTGEVVPPEMKPGEKPPEKKPVLGKIKVRFTVAPDAQPGVRDFRIATPQGVSTIGQLVIVRDPVVMEQAANNTLAEAHEIPIPSTACGTIEKAEDVDFYKFKVEPGTALSFHVQSGRLQNKIHDLQAHSDPIITLRNATGTTLAASDNYFFADPFLRYQFEQAGEYYLEIRDVRYHGNVDWRYSVEISNRPFVTNLFPLGLPLGSPAKVELVGFQLPADPVREITVPAETPEGPMAVGVPMGDQLTNPVPAFASTLPPVLEAAGENNTAATAQMITVPAGISGRIESPADIDCYAFEAKKGDVFSIEVIARRLQSSLDSNLRVLNEKEAQLAENDDARIGRLTYADSWLEAWTAPADGKFAIEVRDLHLRGGPEFVYFVKVTRAAPYFNLTLDTDKTILTPGTNGAIFVRAERKNGFAGEVQLGIDGLPPGVTASCGRILADGQDGVIILQTALDTPRGVGNIRITGSATHPMGEAAPLQLTSVALPLQELYFPGGGRGHWPVEMHTVSVGDAMDVLSIKLSETAVILKPGESKKIDVTITRAEGFTANITLDLLYRHLGSIFGDSLPKGVTLDEKNSQTLLTAGQSSGTIVLVAAADAKPVDKQQVSVMANVSLNFVMKMSYSAEPLTVSVVAP
jgi:hypothetical protein